MEFKTIERQEQTEAISIEAAISVDGIKMVCMVPDAGEQYMPSSHRMSEIDEFMLSKPA